MNLWEGLISFVVLFLQYGLGDRPEDQPGTSQQQAEQPLAHRPPAARGEANRAANAPAAPPPVPAAAAQVPSEEAAALEEDEADEDEQDDIDGAAGPAPVGANTEECVECGFVDAEMRVHNLLCKSCANWFYQQDIELQHRYEGFLVANQIDLPTPPGERPLPRPLRTDNFLGRNGIVEGNWDWVEILPGLITEMDMACLLDGKGLNNNVVDAFLATICVQFGHNFVPTNTLSAFEQGLPQEIWPFPVEGTIFVPTIIGHDQNWPHWILVRVRVDGRRSRIDVFDSAVRLDAWIWRREAKVGHILEMVVAQAQLQGLEAFPGPEDFEKGQAIGIAKQGQGTPDCGVFVCVFGKLLAEGHKSPNFTQDDIRFYRRKIAQILESVADFCRPQYCWLRRERARYFQRLLSPLQRQERIIQQALEMERTPQEMARRVAEWLR